jgi:RES domain-containing protein
MGLVKNQMIDIEERGWDAPEKKVCPACVDDPHLKSIILGSLSSTVCDYCGRAEKTNIAAPVEEIMPSVMGALNHFFSGPGNAGVPYETAEGGWLVQPTDTEDALVSLPLDCNDDLFQDISESISEFNDAWVQAAEGSWVGEHENARLIGGWNAFADHVKHEQRYFFTQRRSNEFGPDIAPSQLLYALGSVVTSLGLIRSIASKTPFYRVRALKTAEQWPRDKKHLSAPPSPLAAAGRMNPAGISYLYLALEQETAVAEVAIDPPSGYVVARFSAQTHLQVLDLTQIPDLPSIFDYQRLEERELLLFLIDFIDKISRPVVKDGREHVEYVPSQVVCEFFASVFRRDGVRLDGILYPSALRPGGRNLVLFPRHHSEEDTFPDVSLYASSEVTADNSAA